MRLPEFLIVGAMKAGTTTLFRDLAANPSCFFSIDKEPHNLTRDSVLTDEGRREYAAMFERARRDQICGEASTGYTKRPTHEGVAARARRVLGEDLKVIYIVRDPVERAISHHYHAFTFGQTSLGVDEAVRQSSEFIDYSRYSWQLEPWIQEFGRDQVLIVHFETYVKDRAWTVENVSRFLQIAPRPEMIEPETVYNQGDSRPMHKGLWTGLKRSGLYRHGVRHLIPRSARELAYRALLPRGPQRPNPPTDATVDYILDRVRDDAAKLATLMGRSRPLWDLRCTADRERNAGPCDTTPSASDSEQASQTRQQESEIPGLEVASLMS